MNIAQYRADLRYAQHDINIILDFLRAGRFDDADDKCVDALWLLKSLLTEANDYEPRDWHDARNTLDRAELHIRHSGPLCVEGLTHRHHITPDDPRWKDVCDAGYILSSLANPKSVGAQLIARLYARRPERLDA